MDSTAPESLAVDAFEVRLADILEVDLASLHALTMSVGWPHRAEDWQFLRDFGRGFVALDEIDRVLGSAMWFAHDPTFATVGMTVTSPRLQTLGVGDWLMRRVLAESGRSAFRLSATRAARRLYLSLGFVPEKTVYQRQGEARRPAVPPLVPDGAVLRRLEAADRDAATALDARAFGVCRAGLLGRLYGHSQGLGVFRDGVLEAFALCRPFGRGHVVGPVVAASDEDAIAVVAPFVAELDGRFLRLDTHLDEGAFPSFLTQSGLPVYDTVLTMSLGVSCFVDPATRGPGRPVTFGLVSQALG
ncbi:GNAT family N-acetyltransferase [Azospirillum sp. RWY-5-1]|uniref:GNAT family N-acetyltransferase n=1 Tax=Azospirillum oleiclasticum TaxID=2735135 RepID=A0ABX2T5I2_9PROT|nr:GNAT family N-acetyltransferase [Azospirillum oleiclasticum]NYZ12266.1 GNAT family N-acetyltransferase [Azospirillum oleiclasticum]NYZ19426.1 GNAT family N-acetyltransferase [Azospirillum oleiclasticum]